MSGSQQGRGPAKSDIAARGREMQLEAFPACRQCRRTDFLFSRLRNPIEEFLARWSPIWPVRCQHCGRRQYRIVARSSSHNPAISKESRQSY